MTLFGFREKQPQYYRGLRIKADTNLHEQIVALIGTFSGREDDGRTARILDVGCGEGALSQRLHDDGYDVLGLDVNDADFKAQGPHFCKVDFNDPVQTDAFVRDYSGKFDIILAVEVIEHVKSPWDFIGLLSRLAGEETNIIITTPNIGSWWGRFVFLVRGEFYGFDKVAWENPGHINPIAHVELQKVLESCGFEVKSMRGAGELPIMWASNWKRLFASLIMLPLRPFLSGYIDGWVLCVHATKRR